MNQQEQDDKGVFEQQQQLEEEQAHDLERIERAEEIRLGYIILNLPPNWHPLDKAPEWLVHQSHQLYHRLIDLTDDEFKKVRVADLNTIANRNNDYGVQDGKVKRCKTCDHALLVGWAYSACPNHDCKDPHGKEGFRECRICKRHRWICSC